MTAFAQPVPAITDADIERARRSQPVITDRDVKRAQRQHKAPSDADLARTPIPSTPRVDALAQPANRTTVDLEALARGFDATGTSPALEATKGPALLIFVSLAMPEATLTRLVDQAARAQATLVLRGLINGSLRETVERVQRLIGPRQVSVQIDPQAFDRFSIVRTPTFVLLNDGAAPAPCTAGTCYPTTSFVAAAGDVSVDYALEFFRRAAPGFSRAAGSFLSRLKGG